MATIGHNSGASPSGLSDADKTSIRQAILEMSDSFTRIEAEREIQKEIINQIEEKYNVPKKLMRKMARTYFGSTFMDQVQEQKDFEAMYQAIVKDDDESEDKS